MKWWVQKYMVNYKLVEKWLLMFVIALVRILQKLLKNTNYKNKQETNKQKQTLPFFFPYKETSKV